VLVFNTSKFIALEEANCTLLLLALVLVAEKIFTPNATPFKVNAGANPFKTPKNQRFQSLHKDLTLY
jgi:hypothetical protein